MDKLAGLVLLLWTLAAGATPGGLDRNGCHNSKSIGYHCHGVKLENIRAYVPGESQFDRSARLAAQCKGKANEGVCFGYVGGQR